MMPAFSTLAEMFIAVVRAGSLSAASLKTRVPLATLSRNVRQLEEELAVQLLERSARGTKLTDAGMLLYEHASRGIDALQEGELAVTSHQNVLKGRLRLSIPPSFEPWWELLAAFQREHPDVQVVVYTTERAVDLSMEGIDVALRIGPVVHESLVAKRLLRYQHVLVASPALLERFVRPKSPDALLALPAAIWVRDANAHRPWRLGEREIEPTIAYVGAEIDQATCVQIEKHLATCARCAGACDALKRTVSLCRRLPGDVVPAAVRTAVRDALMAAISTSSSVGR